MTSTNQDVLGVILAAGLGTRLRPLTYFRSKAAIPYLNRPLVAYALEMLVRLGINRLAINTHHLPKTLERLDLSSWLPKLSGAASPSIHYSYEPQILGTAGALGRLREFLKGHTVMVINGKIYFEEDLGSALEFHRRVGATATLVVLPCAEGAPFNPLLVDESGRVAGYTRERGTRLEFYGTAAGSNLRRCIFAGIHILEPEVLDFIPSGSSDTVTDLYPRLAAAGRSLWAWESRAFWRECSTPRRYLEASLDLLRHRGQPHLLETPTQATCESVVAGRKSFIEEGCRLENCVLWDSVRVGRNSSLLNVIIADAVRLPGGTQLRDAVVTPLPPDAGVTLRERAWVMGENWINPID